MAPPEVLNVVALVAGRVRGLAEELVRAYDLGHEPAAVAEPPWSLSFQIAAVPVYLETLPLMYLRDLATDFGACADLMVSSKPGSVSDESWFIVQQYLTNYRMAVFRHTEPAPRAPTPGDPGSVNPTTPSVMRFGQLASICKLVEVEVLGAAAAEVEGGCSGALAPDLCAEQFGWLQGVAGGVTVASMAAESGLSRATMNRRLADLWKLLGADNRAEGLVAAAALGLLAETD